MNKQKYVLLFLCFALARSASANDAGLEQLLSMSLEDLMATKVTISTSTKQALAKAPSVVALITAEDIKATGARNITEVLQNLPGVYVRRNLFAFRPQITFRGASGTHTLLMVNGQPIRDLVWSSGIFGKGLPTSMIERIEIIRGPGSALFGSDASAGVINIITKTAAGVDKSEVGARAGSFDVREGWAQYGADLNGIRLALTAQASHTDGHAPYIATDAQIGKVSYAPGHAAYGYDNQDIRFSAALGNWRLLADHARHSDLAVGLTGRGVLDPATRGSDTRSDIALLYANDNFADGWGLNAEARYYQLSYSSGSGFYERPPGYVYGGATYAEGFINRMRSAQRGLSAEVSGLYTGFKMHDIKIGVGFKSDDLYLVEQQINIAACLPVPSPIVDVSDTPCAFAPEKSRRIDYLFLQDMWSLANDWALTAGVRYDRYSDYGGTTNPRMALVWQTTDQLVTKLMYGRAFRVPSYLERYSVTSATQPNANLVPERSETWDLSFAYSVSRDLKFGVDFYRFAQTNLIVNNASTQFQYKNMDSNTARGVEFEAQWQATKEVRLSGNYTHRSETVVSPSIPRRKAYVRMDWGFSPAWNWNLQANRIGERALPAGDPRAPLGAYTLVDTTLRYRASKDWELAASIRNLFDVDAREYSSNSIPNNLPLPARSFHAELRYAF